MSPEAPDTMIACVQKFAEGEYMSCIQQDLDLVQTTPSFELFQLLLISYQRCGDHETAENWGRMFLEIMKSRSAWHHALLQLTLGQIDLAQVLRLAQDDRQRCQAHYYAGARFATFHQADAARQEFDLCPSLDEDSMEAQLATFERRRL